MNNAINSRQLFIDTCKGIKHNRTPFWLMRQAGRYLPEYLQLKAQHGFLGIVQTPEVAVEAALQPMRRFDFDCAIIFSDILVIPEALGFPYRFKDGGGITLDKRIETIEDIELAKSNIPYICEKLNYVAENAKLLRKCLPNKGILGFAGTPFTIGAYMVEGESCKDFPRYKRFIKEQPYLFEQLMEVLTQAICEYTKMQTKCDIDAIQIFDSHASIAPKGYYEKLSGKYITQIFDNIKDTTSSILFATNMSDRFDELYKVSADVYSLDDSIRLSTIYAKYNKPLQGNLNPNLLSNATLEQVAQKTKEILEDMKDAAHIFNLGHGIKPDAKIENVTAMSEIVKSFKNG